MTAVAIASQAGRETNATSASQTATDEHAATMVAVARVETVRVATTAPKANVCKRAVMTESAVQMDAMAPAVTVRMD